MSKSNLTTDERLALLTERHEALAQTVELLAADLRSRSEKTVKPTTKRAITKRPPDDDEPREINIKWLGEL